MNERDELDPIGIQWDYSIKLKRRDESTAEWDDANQPEMTPLRVYAKVKPFAGWDLETLKCQSAVWPIMVLWVY